MVAALAIPSTVMVLVAPGVSFGKIGVPVMLVILLVQFDPLSVLLSTTCRVVLSYRNHSELNVALVQVTASPRVSLLTRAAVAPVVILFKVHTGSISALPAGVIVYVFVPPVNDALSVVSVVEKALESGSTNCNSVS